MDFHFSGEPYGEFFDPNVFMRIYVLFSLKLNIAIAYQVQEFVEGLQYNWEVFHHLGPAFFMKNI